LILIRYQHARQPVVAEKVPRIAGFGRVRTPSTHSERVRVSPGEPRGFTALSRSPFSLTNGYHPTRSVFHRLPRVQAQAICGPTGCSVLHKVQSPSEKVLFYGILLSMNDAPPHLPEPVSHSVAGLNAQDGLGWFSCHPGKMTPYRTPHNQYLALQHRLPLIWLPGYNFAPKAWSGGFFQNMRRAGIKYETSLRGSVSQRRPHDLN